MTTLACDIGELNLWQRHGLACVRCERLFRPNESTVPTVTNDNKRGNLRVCQCCRLDMVAVGCRRAKCVLWLCGQCHGGDDCRCVPTQTKSD
jgi:hypothetical protein